MKWRFWIDTGGTFTDCLAENPQGETSRTKVLSNSAIRATVAEMLTKRAIRMDTSNTFVEDFFVGYTFEIYAKGEASSARIVAWDAEQSIATVDIDLPRLAKGDLCSFRSPEEAPLLAVRVSTRKRLEDELPPLEMRLATTRGTNALLEGKVAKTAFLVTKGFGDLLRIGNQQRPNLFELGIRKPDPLYAVSIEVDERLDANGGVLRELDEEHLRQQIRRLNERGVESVAVALLHSYRNAEHEKRVREILRQEGITRVSLSSELAPMIKIVPRAETSVVDASLAPIMESYLDSVEGPLGGSGLRVMTSAGGLVGRENFHSKDGLLSGPAGGVVGSSSVAKRAGFERSIAFDMGGTSTDVSRFHGQLPYQYEQEVGAAHIYAPSLKIETVAAGGGSICWFDGAALRVGPESAGAAPGPACYGAGGPLTLTDVNLLLGRIDASRFGIPVYEDKARERFNELRTRILEASDLGVSDETILEGWLEIANERMAEAIRRISVREGYDPAEYCLVAFGGAGGLHACSIADILGMNTILFPADSGLLSAYGLNRAKQERFEERQILQTLDACATNLDVWNHDLSDTARRRLTADGVAESEIRGEAAWVEMRYLGQESTITIAYFVDSNLKDEFEEAFSSQYGFVPNQPIEVVSLRVCVYTGVIDDEIETFTNDVFEASRLGKSAIWRDDIAPGRGVRGPVAVQDPFSAFYLAENWVAVKGNFGSLKLKRIEATKDEGREKLDTIELELFTNRFLSTVEEMGGLLERSAFSTNVKERRDFSCALLDSEGYLIANAPHIPVHLGALGVCVRESVAIQPLEAGDILIVNHPGFGGSHLPDVTLIAAVYSDEGERIAYVANRAHHAEIGGISPGSMPPDAKSLEEEGVVFAPTLLAKKGVIDWEGVERILTSANYPTRRLQENLSDLAAQVAAIRLGVESLNRLAEAEGAARVCRYLGALRKRSAQALREALETHEIQRIEAIERLDSGAEIRVTVFREADRWIIDFTGSAPQQNNNYNATPSIVTSAVIYVLRLLAKEDLPLNEGFLDVVDIRIPQGMLNPDFSGLASESPPVVAGNVEISQRIVDTLIKAFGLAACSQGTMNNFIFGNDQVSYYETIAGGEGATSERNGASGVHVHMTNTAITDPEILEKRFPVRLEQFALRRKSGGKGKRSGGEGVIRRIQFMDPVKASLLTQHRTEAPFGVEGGECGKPGRQCVFRSDGSVLELSSDASIEIEPGDEIEIRTPGGGAWGD